ncbi:unnamed protein product [Symbiodinium sp. CCMP2592]|nr:unnamed protein product [Symbiodinium sp. CCMP2592]
MAPKNKAKAAPKTEPKAKRTKSGALVIGDDPTPVEMKASIQRMLNLVKYKADPVRNKSGECQSEAQQVLEAYRQIADSDRKGFIAAYQKNGLKDLKWVGQYTKKVVKEEAEEDRLPREEAEGVAGGFAPGIRKIWGHERNLVKHKMPELCRYFYRTLVESKDATRSTESGTFEMAASIAAKEMKCLQNSKGEVKLEHPERTELSNLSKVKSLDAKHGELSSECIALENCPKLASKAPEVRVTLDALKKFVEDLRKIQVLLDRKLPTMDEAACKNEKADMEQWNRNANEHLDNVKLLLKKVKGWQA